MVELGSSRSGWRAVESVVCRVLERLKSGEIDRVDMDPSHTMMYKHKFCDTKREVEIDVETYLWVDWFSMHQSGAEREEDIGKERMASLRSEGSNAIRSIPHIRGKIRLYHDSRSWLSSQ